MPQTPLDPEQVRKLANELQEFNSDLKQKADALRQRIEQVRASTPPEALGAVAEELDASLRALERFMQIADSETPRALQRAEQIEKQLRQPPGTP
jgi:prefoldin subunit 5